MNGQRTDIIQSRVDLNCDFGEGFGAYSFGQDEALLAFVTSVNIACGFHAGDPHTIRETVFKAAAAGVAIGAHPGLPDRLGFGRREMNITAAEAYDLTLYQLGALGAFAGAAGCKMRHVKPHGALYHMADKRPEIAEAIVRAAKAYDPGLRIYAQSGGLLLEEARKQALKPVSEAFVDRTYLQGGKLTPRGMPGATLHRPEEALEQAKTMVLSGIARTSAGGETPVRADTLCLHGDGPRAADIAAMLRSGLEAAGIELMPPD